MRFAADAIATAPPQLIARVDTQVAIAFGASVQPFTTMTAASSISPSKNVRLSSAADISSINICKASALFVDIILTDEAANRSGCMCLLQKIRPLIPTESARLDE